MELAEFVGDGTLKQCVDIHFVNVPVQIKLNRVSVCVWCKKIFQTFRNTKIPNTGSYSIYHQNGNWKREEWAAGAHGERRRSSSLFYRERGRHLNIKKLFIHFPPFIQTTISLNQSTLKSDEPQSILNIDQEDMWGSCSDLKFAAMIVMWKQTNQIKCNNMNLGLPGVKALLNICIMCINVY